MTAHVTQYWAETQGWGSSAAAPLPPQATEAGERPGGARALHAVPGSHKDPLWPASQTGSVSVVCCAGREKLQDRTGKNGHCVPCVAQGLGERQGGAMGKDPSGKERELEGCFWKAASLPRLRSPMNDPPRKAGLIYSWGLGSNWQE